MTSLKLYAVKQRGWVKKLVRGGVLPVDSRQISPKVGLMLQMLDLVSLAHLAGLRAVSFPVLLCVHLKREAVSALRLPVTRQGV